MAKLFFDVFPTLDVSGDMKKILSEMEVTKVGMNHERDHIRVYLLGSHLIHKNNITQLEKSIEEQIFKGKRYFRRVKSLQSDGIQSAACFQNGIYG